MVRTSLSRSLTLLLIAAAVFAGLSACGGDDDSEPGGGGSPSSEFTPSTDPARNIPPDQRNQINAVVAGGDFTIGWNNFVFGITNLDDEPQGGAKAVATFYDLTDPKNPKPVHQAEAVQSAPGVGETVSHTHSSGEVHEHGGEDEDRVGYYVPVKFDHAGVWGVSIQATLKDGTKGVSNVAFEVLEKARTPVPGEPALKSDNLTKADVDDIKEIDSGDPPNDMHDVKIKDSIAAGRPLVIVFATPAYCTSRFCGPVVEEIEDLADDYGDRVDFVHVEIWRDFGKQELNATAREWLVGPDGGLTEPYVFVVGKDGVVYDRWEGPVARNIVESAVRAVADSEVYKPRD